MKTKLLKKCRKKVYDNICFVNDMFDTYIISYSKDYDPMWFDVVGIRDIDMCNVKRIFLISRYKQYYTFRQHIEDYIKDYILSIARKERFNTTLYLTD